jgi:glucan endo-1,3-alpha-glucosidase
MKHSRRRASSILRLLVLPFAAILAHSCAYAQRTVFAHYLLTNQDYQGDSDPTQEAKISAYEREIQQAQAVGIDGFALDVGGWLNQTYYIRYSAQMFEAAARLNNGFKLMFSADMCCGNGVNDVEDMMRRFANNPRYAPVYFKRNGVAVLTTFVGDSLGTSAWQQIRSDLANGSNPSTTAESTVLSTASGAPSNASLPIFLVPAFFFGGELPTQPSIQQGFNEWSSIIDGSFYWGIAGVPGSGGSLDQLPSSEAYASVVHGGGKLYMAPVTIQFWGANANRYYEYSGFSGMRKMWMDAINVSHPDWVEIITWNDFIEGSYVSPIDDPNKYPNANFLNTTGVPSSTLGYFHSHYAVTDLLPYFIQWYKTGTQPAITQDAVYYAYRTQPASANPGTPSVANKYGPVADVIYITSNLTAPATLKVTSAGQSTLLNLPAGSSDTQTPFVLGDKPSFELDRNGQPLDTTTATDLIQSNPQYNDYYYSTGDLIVSAGGGATPAAPTQVSATASGTSINLSWTGSSGASSYSIFRGTSSNGESTTPLATGITGTHYTDSGLTSGTTYYYKVAAVNAAGSTQSSEVSAQAGSSGSGLPDLIVTSVTMNPATPHAGDHVVFTAVVKNQGTGATPAGTVLGVGFDLDGSTGATNWEDTDTASLAPGASITLTATGGNSGANYWVATAGSHTVTAWVDDVNRIQESNENNNKLANNFTVTASTLTPVLQINAGGGVVNTFVADQDSNTGNHFSSSAAIDTSEAANPAPAVVYQTSHWASAFTYTIPGLTSGRTYTIRLHFAELTWTNAGQRKFNVAINGTTVLPNFDIFATAGAQNRALTEQFTATANSGQIVISFTNGGVDNPEVNGIEVLQ